MAFDIGRQQLKLMDYGLARVYKDKNNHFKTEVFGIEQIGNMLYSSKYNWLGSELYPRDDIISIGYVLICMATSTLPWVKCWNKRQNQPFNRDQVYQEVYEMVSINITFLNTHNSERKYNNRSTLH